MKPLHTRPFNADHAKAGAPYCCRNGEEATVLKWDCRDPAWPFVGCFGDEDESNEWRADGSHNEGINPEYDLVMTPLGFIDGKPVFFDSELEHADGTKVTGHCAAYHGMEKYRWPAPAPVYPETRMSEGGLCSAYYAGANVIGPQAEVRAFKRIANAALRHAIEQGQVVVPGEAVAGLRPFNPYTGRPRFPADVAADPMGTLVRHKDEPVRAAKHFYGRVDSFHIEGDESSIAVAKELIERSSARDMAIAKVVRDATYRSLGTILSPGPDLAALIAGVAP